MQRKYITAEQEDYVRIVTKPLEYLTVAMDDKSNGGRDSALILTEEDIINIKRYEKRSLDLPITLSQVENTLGFERSDIRGLEPQDMLLFYQDINNHARTWAGIEKGIKDTGHDIDSFAQSFTSLGEILINTVENLDIYQQLVTMVGSLSLENIEGMKSTPLKDADLKLATTLSSILSDRAKIIAKYEQNTEELISKTTTFSKTLAEQLIPEVRRKAVLASQTHLDQQVEELERDIAQLTKDIDQKSKEFSQAKKNIAWGGFGGPIGVAITGGIFGSQAERARKEKNRLIAEKNSKIEELNKKRPLAAAIRSLEIHFEDMSIRMMDAEQSSANLRDMWTVLGKYISNSADVLAKITDDKTLLEFAIEFRDVVHPWENIKGITNELLRLFASALTQYKLEQSQQS